MKTFTINDHSEDTVCFSFVMDWKQRFAEESCAWAGGMRRENDRVILKMSMSTQ